ncbi:MAG: alpha/beta fold hydrolase, partial [Pseudomonadales bacterium]
MLDSLLATNWVCLLLGATVLLVGGSLFFLRRRTAHAPVRILLISGSVAFALLGLLMSTAAFYHLITVAQMDRKFPAPGQMVDVGGYDMHIMCAGTNRVRADGRRSPTVIWIPGAHSPGLMSNHLHEAIAAEARSCIYDRAGSGWSDIGTLPKTIQVEVRELEALLRNVGEVGPFVVSGHSLGGTLAMNFAARHPELVSGLMLIDAASVDMYLYDREARCTQAKTLSRLGALSAAFGLQWAAVRSAGGPKLDLIYSRLGEDLRLAMAAYDARPKAFIALGSVY